MGGRGRAGVGREVDGKGGGKGLHAARCVPAFQPLQELKENERGEKIPEEKNPCL